MKAKLLSNQPAFGVSVMIPSLQIVEMIGRLGFDWGLIDCEHGGRGGVDAGGRGVARTRRHSSERPHDAGRPRLPRAHIEAIRRVCQVLVDAGVL
jgi:hypothetical protein